MRVLLRFGIVAVLVTALGALLTGTATASPGQGPSPETVALRFESKIGDLGDAAFAEQALATLNDPRGWGQAGFSFRSDPSSSYRVVLAEPADVDALCLPLITGGRVSCQNGDVVAINANRWRNATDDWDKGADVYRQYVINHEVGHLIGQFHPENRCPRPGEPEAVMAQQTKGLEGCQGNPWPLDWEIAGASVRPVDYAPTPDVKPAVRAVNPGGGVPGNAAPATTAAPPPTTAAASVANGQVPATEAPATVDDGEAPVDPESRTDDSTAIEDSPLEDSLTEKLPLSGLAADDARDGDGSRLPAVIVLSFLAITLVTLGVALLLRWRSTRRQAWGPPDDTVDLEAPPVMAVDTPDHAEGWESESIDDLFGWSVELGGGAGRTAGVTWAVPSRWDSHQTADFVAGLTSLDQHSVNPDEVATEISSMLRSRPGLRPREGEGLGVIMVGSSQLVAAVLGAAEVVEHRGDRTSRTRRQGVVRLRGDGEGALEVVLSQSGNDWPTASVTVREQSRVSGTGPSGETPAVSVLPG